MNFKSASRRSLNGIAAWASGTKPEFAHFARNLICGHGACCSAQANEWYGCNAGMSIYSRCKMLRWARSASRRWRAARLTPSATCVWRASSRTSSRAWSARSSSSCHPRSPISSFRRCVWGRHPRLARADSPTFLSDLFSALIARQSESL